jgi:succinate-semialdehyde dehydrogenase/glutarate-semialdehyde dehydrogenase
MSIQSINPATGAIIKTYQEMPRKEIQRILEQTQTAYELWRKSSFTDRAILMHRAAAGLRDKKETYARLMAIEMGKPLAQGIAEIEKCAWVCEYYAQNAERFLSPEIIPTNAKKSFVSFQPLGIILAVMPWNFPFWQVFRFAAPSVMAGNAAILKHASNVSGCALAIEQIFIEAGFPENLFRTVLVSGSNVGPVIEHPLVKAVTITGSTPAGRAVAAKAGAMLKKTVLELGGSDPYIILADADLEPAVSACVTARLINTGQSCIAAKRFIIPRTIQEPFEKLFVEGMKSKKMGDPLIPGIDLGPLARVDLRDELHHQVQRSIKSGARVLLGGSIPEGIGAYYPPTVLTEVNKGMPAYDEELFGPVAAIIPVENEEEAIRIANDTPFGLGAAVFTKDINKGIEIAEKRIEAGCCFVNDFVRSDPRLPFGGVKESGYGRELSVFGIREFMNIKTIYVAK